MLIVKMLLGIALLGSIAWLIAAPDFEPTIAVVTSFAAFIAAWIGDKKGALKHKQKQNVEKNSIGIQAGGDVNMGSIQDKEKSADAE
ncbi:MAG: hypothetical protein RLN96_04055 [Pseudomonadales bacterium]